MLQLCDSVIELAINSRKLAVRSHDKSCWSAKTVKKQADVSLSASFTSIFTWTSAFSTSALNWHNDLVSTTTEEMNLDFFTTSSFLSNSRISSNARVAISSSVLLFDVITDLFQLSLVEISDCSVNALSMQSWIMCIKYAWVFHNETEMYNCNVIFYNKIMYWKCDHCWSKKTEYLAVNTLINCIS